MTQNSEHYQKDLRKKNQKYREHIGKLNNSISALKKRVERDAETIHTFGRNIPLNNIINFSRSCREQFASLRADVYVAHGVQALPAAAILSKLTGGKHYCDVIEIPSFFKRVVPTHWDSTMQEFLENALENYLRDADGLLTVGYTLAEELRRYGPEVNAIPNYRYKEELVRTDTLRKNCGLGQKDKLILSISRMTSGFEAVLEAMKMLPDHVHLATLGRFAPEQYATKINKLIDQLAIPDRVHLFDQVPYSQLTTIASAADAGLIVLNPEVPNNRVSLPNRIFDYMFSGLPVVSPDIPDIARILLEESMGVVIKGTDAESWCHGITKVLETSAEMKQRASDAADRYSWENVEDELQAVLGHPGSIVFIGLTDLTRNNRTMRMARSLAERDAKVIICTPIQGKIEYLHQNIQLFGMPPL